MKNENRFSVNVEDGHLEWAKRQRKHTKRWEREKKEKITQQTKQFNEFLNGCVNMLIKRNLIIENEMLSWIAMNDNEENHSIYLNTQKAEPPSGFFVVVIIEKLERDKMLTMKRDRPEELVDTWNRRKECISVDISIEWIHQCLCVHSVHLITDNLQPLSICIPLYVYLQIVRPTHTYHENAYFHQFTSIAHFHNIL